MKVNWRGPVSLPEIVIAQVFFVVILTALLTGLISVVHLIDKRSVELTFQDKIESYYCEDAEYGIWRNGESEIEFTVHCESQKKTYILK